MANSKTKNKNHLIFCSRYTLIEAEIKCGIEKRKIYCVQTYALVQLIGRELHKSLVEGTVGVSVLKIRRKMAIKINMHLVLVIESIVISR